MPPPPAATIKSVGSHTPEKANPLAARPDYRKAGTQSYGSLLSERKETAGPPNGQYAILFCCRAEGTLFAALTGRKAGSGLSRSFAAETGKPSERAGRKATGLPPVSLPGEHGKWPPGRRTAWLSMERNL